MKKNNFLFLRQATFVLSALALLFSISCEEKDEEVKDPIASFQFEISTTNFLEVQFENFSQNADTYAWDFGDGGTSTDENPLYAYDEAGTYEVVLTATNTAGVSVSRSEDVVITDPDAELTKLAGFESKTWILQREGIALGIGPSTTSTEWWSFGGVTPLGDRPCILDDEYTFTRAGAFQFDSKNTIFVDGIGNGGWNNENPDKCFDESAVNFTSVGSNDMSAYKNGGNYTFELEGGELTLTGDGVYIGLANKTNLGDIGQTRGPQSELLYKVVKLVDGEDVDSLQLAMQVNGGDVYWNFYLVHYDNESLKPAIPTAQPVANFNFEADDLTVTFTNTSANASTYAWTFGDGATSTQASPVHTYAAAGEYDVTLVASGAGSPSTVTKSVLVGVALPTPTTMGHTFVNAAGANLLSKIQGASTIELGVDDPTDATGAKVGKFNRTDAAFQESILSFDPPSDINYVNITKVSIEVYLPSTNTYGALTRTVIVGLGDALVNPSGNWWEDHAQYETTIAEADLNKWVKLEYDITTPNSGANTSNPKTRMDLDMVFINIGGGGHSNTGTFYIRNLKFE
jgi:PKD repeat protein